MSQLTLGDFVDILSNLNQNESILLSKDNHEKQFLSDYFDSYRGYYDQLSIEPTDIPFTIEDILKSAQKAVNQKFTGYKGGEYLMEESTPIWLASYGSCGSMITGVKYTKYGYVLETEEED